MGIERSEQSRKHMFRELCVAGRHFLSDRHNRYFCQQKNNVKKDANNNNKILRLCLACDIDAMFSAVFSGDRLPYTPSKFLYSWWQHTANLASYEQQDAHEFFMLDGIHEKVEKDKRESQNQDELKYCQTLKSLQPCLLQGVVYVSSCT